MPQCPWCNTPVMEKDVLAINRKLLGTQTAEFYCLPCFAEYLGCTEDDLREKIAEFKQDGCTLFS